MPDRARGPWRAALGGHGELGYVRLRLEQYGEAELAEWAVRIAAAPWGDAHVYFMHEPTAPRYAAALARLYEASLPTG